MKFYGYAGCDSCRKAKKWLQAQDIAFEEIAIREQPPSLDELRRMYGYLGEQAKKLFNTSSKDYRALGGKAQVEAMSLDEVFAALRANGNLIKRPFVLTDDDGTVGFHADAWAERFGP